MQCVLPFSKASMKLSEMKNEEEAKAPQKEVSNTLVQNRQQPGCSSSPCDHVGYVRLDNYGYGRIIMHYMYVVIKDSA